MHALEYGAIVVVFVTTAVLYFHGFLRVAAVLGVLFWAATAHLLHASVGPLWMSLLFIPLGLAPALFLLLHAIDIRTGMCTAPTVYSIPIAFFLGAILVLATGLLLATGAGVLLA